MPDNVETDLGDFFRQYGTLCNRDSRCCTPYKKWHVFWNRVRCWNMIRNASLRNGTLAGPRFLFVFQSLDWGCQKMVNVEPNKHKKNNKNSSIGGDQSCFFDRCPITSFKKQKQGLTGPTNFLKNKKYWDSGRKSWFLIIFQHRMPDDAGLRMALGDS